MPYATQALPSIAAARCRMYLLLANIFRYPDENSRVLKDAKTWDVLLAAADYLDEDTGAQVAVPAAALHEHLTRLWPEELEGEYLRAFGTSVRGKVTPYECEYGNKEIFQRAGEMSDIAAFYSAFGLRVNPDAHEPLDHIAAECEFMALLCAREAECANIDTDRLEIVIDAEKKFLREHVGRWGVAFSHQLSAVNPNTAFAAAADLLEALLVFDCNRLGVPRGTSYLALRNAAPADDPSNCMSCGKAEGIPGAIEPREE